VIVFACVDRSQIAHKSPPGALKRRRLCSRIDQHLYWGAKKEMR
jgi:hypothetical protein